MNWKRSSLCDANACVEVTMDTMNFVLVRDSKDPSGPVLTFTHDEWLTFISDAKRGKFDLPEE